MTKLTLPPVRPDPEILLSIALATGGESSRFDFKEKLDLSSDEHKVRLVKAIGAFANTDEGGFVFVGISDKRKIVGLSEKLAAKFDQTAVQNILRAYLTPPPTIQVRHHEHEKKQIVIIEVEPFAEIPCIVKLGATQGSERLFAGTFLHRNDAAQSTVLTAEKDIRALCDAIVRRRATSFLDLIQRGSKGMQDLGEVVGHSCKNKIWELTATAEAATFQVKLAAAQRNATAVSGLSCTEGSVSLITNCWQSVSCKATAFR